MKRILIALPNDTLGGAEQYLKQISEYYINKDYIVDVFFLKRRTGGSWDNISAYLHCFYTKASSEQLGLLPMIINLLISGSKHHYEHIYTSHTHISGIVGFLRKIRVLKSEKLVCRESTSIFVRFSGFKLAAFKFWYRIGFRSADIIICQTEFMKKQLLSGMPSYFSKFNNIVVIPNPIALKKIKELVIQSKPLDNYIVAAGRLIEEKGFDILIKAFSRVSPYHRQLKMVILGEGHKRSDLEALVDRLSLNHKVFLPGHVNDVYTYFKFAKACVISSRVEGFPNVLLQMMSQNPCVVSTLCAGDIDKIASVFFCKTEDEQDLANAINKALSSDCSKNEAAFAEELKSRNIDTFVETIRSLCMSSTISSSEIEYL